LFFHQQRDWAFTERSENFLGSSKPLSREGNTGAYPKYTFSGGSEPHDSNHFESETGIQLHNNNLI
jgi:hypothetical protein